MPLIIPSTASSIAASSNTKLADFKKKRFNEEESAEKNLNSFEHDDSVEEVVKVEKKKQFIKGKIILVLPNGVIINVNGNGQSVIGKFGDKKIDDEIEVEI